MELVLPSAKYKGSFIDAVKEFQAEDDYTYRNKWYRRLVVSELETDFEAFVERELSHARGENLPPGYVPYTDYWLIDKREYIGRTTIRHHLNETLSIIGGHIGYDVRPSKRRQGYGNKLMEGALEKAKELGLTRVLMTSDTRNVASQKIIEKYGGIFESKIPNTTEGFEGREVLRYWIELE